MQPHSRACLPGWIPGWSWLLAGALAANAGATETLTVPPVQVVTNLAQFDHLASQARRTACSIRLEAVVCWADPGPGTVILQDASGAVCAEVDPRSEPVTPGQKVLLEGNGSVAGVGANSSIGRMLLVDNDGIHNPEERSGVTFLKAGKHPISVSWFGRDGAHGLEADYEGPGLPRQRIPDSALSRAAVRPVGGAVTWSPGVDYQAYEGRWVSLPDFQPLTPARRGSTTNFNLAVISRGQDVALLFSGYVEVPRDGRYTFSTISTLGSQLFVGLPWLRVVGDGPVPVPRRLAPGHSLAGEPASAWAEMEGLATFVNSVELKGLSLELSAGTGRTRVEVTDGSGCSPRLLCNSRLRAVGLCRDAYTTDGQRIGTLLVRDSQALQLLEAPSQLWLDYPTQPISAVVRTNYPAAAETIVHLVGSVRSQAAAGRWSIADGTGQLLVEAPPPPPPAHHDRVEVLGRWSRAGSNVVLRCAVCRAIADPNAPAGSALPVLTTAEQVKRLRREEAVRGYPVRLRGVVTATYERDVVIQDATWGIYVDGAAPALARSVLPRVGEYWEVEGVTGPGNFAPVVVASRAACLGAGNLPEPLHPTWDQLINGSLDSQYAELQGIITEVETGGLTLLTRGGRIRLTLLSQPPEALRGHENGLVRIRGCVFPQWDAATRQVKVGEVGLVNASVSVDEPAAADLFAAPAKRLPELLLYDLNAGAFQRVKVACQILQQRGGVCYATDGTNGVRFIPKQTTGLHAGDRVEVVGFPELGAPSPVLREAVVRQLSRAALPPPQRLAQDALLSRRYDSMLVRVEARLANLGLDQSEQVLELQVGTRGFVARLDTRRGLLPRLLPGSRLELTGVYVGQGGDLASGRDLDSFELLLNAPRDIRVLARPSWWTARHTLTLVGVMALVLLGAVVWITLLRRQVEERSRQLTTEIRRHEQTERERAVEEERARIARDLHDDLGATLTQIRFLSALESRDALVPQTTRSRMSQVSEKLREMVASLDEIVWAVNPANDSLPSLATYLCQFAEEFLRPTPIRCRLDVEDALPATHLTSEVRHNLYLAVREALNNIAKHSQATEVWLRIQCPQHSLRIALEDNGRGFSDAAGPGNGEGLTNMRRRLEKISGRFEYETHPGAGTACRIWLPLA